MTPHVPSWRCHLCGEHRVSKTGSAGHDWHRHYLEQHYVTPAWKDRQLKRMTSPTPAGPTVVDRRAELSGRRSPGWRREAARTA